MWCHDPDCGCHSGYGQRRHDDVLWWVTDSVAAVMRACSTCSCVRKLPSRCHTASCASSSPAGGGRPCATRSHGQQGVSPWLDAGNRLCILCRHDGLAVAAALGRSLHWYFASVTGGWWVVGLTCARGTRATRAAKVGEAVRRTAGSGSLMRAISGTSSSCVYAASDPAEQACITIPPEQGYLAIMGL